MHLRRIARLITLFLPVVCLASGGERAAAQNQRRSHHLEAKDGKFLLDGVPIQLISGEMHYPRIPRSEWRARMQMAKALGLNAITTYVFWNEHEQKPGQYDFSGNRDLAAFLHEAQAAGLWVILRPGPYVCAEWEYGGFPAWLGKDPAVKLRTSDPRFMTPATAFLKRVGQEVKPLLGSNGGPIIAVQVENEYAEFGSDAHYMQQIEEALRVAGFGDTFMYSTDGWEASGKVQVPHLFSAVNFGPGKIGDPADPNSQPAKATARIQSLQPGSPVLVGEYWTGWFNHLGEPAQHRDAAVQARQLEWMLRRGYSVSLYMFHGGTSFGWMNGANSGPHSPYAPDVTSYDYDAILPEDGRPGAKYLLFRNAIARATGRIPPPIPKLTPTSTFPAVRLTQFLPLWQTLPAAVKNARPLSMEDLDQAYGYLLYRTKLPAGTGGTLHFDAVHQYAAVYLNGARIGTVDRRLAPHDLTLPAITAEATLDVLVENTGRINYGPNLQGERIGILGEVSLNGRALRNWAMYSLPLDTPPATGWSSAACAGPCFERGTLNVTQPADTFLDTRTLHKGQLWVNGKNLGRAWEIGPSGSLFLPASWLHKGSNDVVGLDLETDSPRDLATSMVPLDIAVKR